MCARFHVNAYDLLGQAEIYPPHIFLPGETEPKLEIAWNSYHQNFFGNIPDFFRYTRLPKAVPLTYVLRDCRIERSIPQRAILAAFLLHVAFILMPWPQLPAAALRNPAFDNTELTWSGPIEDLPLLNSPRQKKSPATPKKADDPPPTEGADAYHPRQRIFTDPAHPTHPRQTLINPAAPPDAPKILPAMPNIVQLAASQAPSRPHMEISERTLAKLRPHQAKRVATTDTPPPDVPNLEQRPAEISLAATTSGPAKPQLQINAGSTPRLAARTQPGEVAPNPEDPALGNNSAGSPPALIALSANPAPPAPVVPVPQGNLAARVSISPEGKQPGIPGGSPGAPNGASGDSTAGGNTAGGNNAIGVVISGGNPKPSAGISGLGEAGKYSLSKSQGMLKRPDPNASVEDVSERDGPPNFSSLPPGSPPEQIFSSRRVYTMNVNMPNLNSATGSWIIHFSELRLMGVPNRAGVVNAPVPVRKVDPKYPSTLIQEHVEGEVILYAVIRQDGTVDSIQVVRGLDDQLDGNALTAFSQWKFQPASKDGQLVDLEAIVHIPFRGPERR
jgi:TonB family protein